MKKLFSTVFALSAGFCALFTKAFASEGSIVTASNPSTGDSTGSMLIIFVVVLIVAGIGIAGFLLMMKNRK